MLLVLFRAVVAAREREDQRVISLEVAELAQRARMVGQLDSRGAWLPERCRNAFANSLNEDGDGGGSVPASR